MCKTVKYFDGVEKKVFLDLRSKNRNEAGFLAPFWFVQMIKREKMKSDLKINMEVFYMKSSGDSSIQIPVMRNSVPLEIGDKLVCLEKEHEESTHGEEPAAKRTRKTVKKGK